MNNYLSRNFLKLRDIYSKEINFKTEEDEIQEDFDLNAFYEQAKAEKLKKKKERL